MILEQLTGTDIPDTLQIIIPYIALIILLIFLIGVGRMQRQINKDQARIKTARRVNELQRRHDKISAAKSEEQRQRRLEIEYQRKQRESREKTTRSLLGKLFSKN